MTEQGAQYDHIGSKYDEYARTATLKRAESYTFFRMVGALHGQRVMDLACGFGFYTRLLKQQGGIRLKRDSLVSVMYAEELNSAKSSVTLQSTDRHGILG